MLKFSLPEYSFTNIGFEESRQNQASTRYSGIRQYLDEGTDRFSDAMDQDDPEFSILQLIGTPVSTQDCSACKYMDLDYVKKLGRKVLKWCCRPADIMPQLISPHEVR